MTPSPAGSFEIVYQLIASLGVCGSLIIISTGVVFPALLRHRLYHIVFFLSFSQMLVNLSGTLGDPSLDDPVTCGAKSFLWVVFSPSAWLWNLFLIASLRDCILNKKETMELSRVGRSAGSLGAKGVGNLPPSTSFLSIRFMHSFVWMVALAFSMVPLAYDLHPLEVACNGTDRTGYEVLYGTMFGILCLCIILSVYYLRSIYVYLDTKEPATVRAEINTLTNFQMYNVVLVLTWVTLCFSYVIVYFVGITLDGDDNMEQFEELTSLFPLLLGLWNGLIFLRYSKEARGRWSQLFKRIFQSITNSSHQNSPSYYLLDNDELSQGAMRQNQSNRGGSGMQPRRLTDSGDLLRSEKDIWVEENYYYNDGNDTDDKEQVTSRLHDAHLGGSYDSPSVDLPKI